MIVAFSQFFATTKMYQTAVRAITNGKWRVVMRDRDFVESVVASFDTMPNAIQASDAVHAWVEQNRITNEWACDMMIVSPYELTHTEANKLADRLQYDNEFRIAIEDEIFALVALERRASEMDDLEDRVHRFGFWHP